MTTLIDCQELQREEIESLETIFGSAWSKYDENSETYRLALERNSQQSIELQITFIDGYPIRNPPKYSIFAPWLKGTRRQRLMDELENTIKQNVNEPVIYRLAQTIYDFLDEKNDEQSTDVSDQIKPLISEEKYSCPKIFTDEPTEEDRASIFQAHCARIEHESQVQMVLSPVHNKDEVQLVLNKLKENKKIANATHNMYAYRIIDEKRNTILADCDDDGETGASSRMLHLMDIADVKNVLVVVSRWFGGVFLHNDRFKHINNATRMILVNHGYIKKIKTYLGL